MANSPSSIPDILTTLKKGRFVAVTDAKNRENEADLIIPAQYITTPKMAFLIRYTSGIICVAMTKERLKQLQLKRLATDNPANFDTPFMMPVDLNSKTRGGVSAQERAATIKALVDPKTKPNDFGKPGHVYPLQAHEQRLAGRQGHTEASVALMELAGLNPAAVIGELINDTGTMMRGKLLREFVQEHNIPLCSIQDIIEYDQHSTS